MSLTRAAALLREEKTPQTKLVYRRKCYRQTGADLRRVNEMGHRLHIYSALGDYNLCEKEH